MQARILDHNKMSKTQSSAAQTREIRAVYDGETITVYQAYNKSIAYAAVEAQRLDASPLFKPSRMTWIKPSWNWMMYRSGYSHKDSNQSHILALKLLRTCFDNLLLASIESTSANVERGTTQVRVQWDPERDFRISPVDVRVRSIQIGVPGGVHKEAFIAGIVSIEDVTEIARKLKRKLDEDDQVSEDQLKERGLLPMETVYPMTDEVKQALFP